MLPLIMSNKKENINTLSSGARNELLSTLNGNLSHRKDATPACEYMICAASVATSAALLFSFPSLPSFAFCSLSAINSPAVFTASKQLCRGNVKKG